MSAKTAIEWTDATWNPVTGCTEVSPGCHHCYAKTFAERFRGTPGHYFEHGFDMQLRPDKLDQPLRWRKPRRIFVNSMSDLFHDQVPDDYIAQVFAVMSVAHQHTFQVLTKRHSRMRALLSDSGFRDAMGWHATRLHPYWTADEAGWPLPNCWIGVSVENQQWADIRIPVLLDTPAAVRFVSAEPLLAPIDLTPWIGCPHDSLSGVDQAPLHSPVKRWRCDQCCASVLDGTVTNVGLHWVIVGGESGHGARPMHPDWARSLRDQCQAAGVPFLFKQWGEYRPAEQTDDVSSMTCVQASTGVAVKPGQDPATQAPGGWVAMRRVGKRASGRELDGRTWDQYPDQQEVSQ